MMLAVCGLAFAVVAETALRSPVAAIDLSVTDQLHRYASLSIDGLMRGLTDLGSTIVLTGAVCVVVIALATRGDRAAALFVAAALIGTLALNGSLKDLFARPRPELDWAEPMRDASFPSGHAMNAFVVYMAFGLVALRAWGLWAGTAALSLALMIAISVGISRIYLGVHWATDVAGGVLAGALYLLILVPAWLSARRRVEPWARTRSGGGGEPP